MEKTIDELLFEKMTLFFRNMRSFLLSFTKIYGYLV